MCYYCMQIKLTLNFSHAPIHLRKSIKFQNEALIQDSV